MWFLTPYVSGFAAIVLFVLFVHFCFAAFLAGPSEREFFREIAVLPLAPLAARTGLVKLHGRLLAGPDGERTSLLTGLPTVWAQLEGGWAHSEDGPVLLENHGQTLWLREGTPAQSVAVHIAHRPAAYKTCRLLSRKFAAAGRALPPALRERLLEHAGASARFLLKMHVAAELQCSELFFVPGDAVFVIGRLEPAQQRDDGSGPTVRVDLSTDGAILLAARDERPWQAQRNRIESRIRRHALAAAVLGFSLCALLLAMLVSER